MDCPTCEAMVDAYVDGELTAVESAAFEHALEACPECRKRLQSARAIGSLLRDLPAEPAPDLLRARIERELRMAARPTIRGPLGARLRWGAIAASLVVALGLGWMGGTMTTLQANRDPDALVAWIGTFTCSPTVLTTGN